MATVKIGLPLPYLLKKRQVLSSVEAWTLELIVGRERAWTYGEWKREECSSQEREWVVFALIRKQREEAAERQAHPVLKSINK